jgi:hypothetical protein
MVNRFAFRNPPSEELVRRTDQEVVEPFSKQLGFRGYYAFQSGEREITTVHMWDSEGDAERAIATTQPQFQAVLGPELAGPPQRSGGEVRAHRQRS